MQGLTIRKPDDMHVHLRDGNLMRRVLPYTARHFARALIMPNVPRIRDVYDMSGYEGSILGTADTRGFRDFQPLMTIMLGPNTTPEIVKRAKAAGAVAAKLYPDGVTTGSEDGVRDFKALYPVLDAMQEVGLVLCIHGEMPDVFVLNREVAFLPVLEDITFEFPRLKVVLEHVSTERAALWVANEAPETVSATITAHHLCRTLDDLVGGLLRPHEFCKPIPKAPFDQHYLRQAVTSGNPKFFFGSDSAPHERSAKESACGCAGCFTAPVVLATLAEVFEDMDALDRLEDFTSRFGAEFYGLPPNEGTITLVREPWTVPAELASLVPWRTGEMLRWRVFP
jgi:dihydroorotase